MATLGSVMNSALKSMTASQLALSVASNNIANAQTPGFTRQRLITTPAAPDGGTLPIGTGVDVVGIQAVRDALIEMRQRQEISAKAGDDATAQSLSDIEGLFSDSDDTGLLLSMTNFFNSFSTVSLDPASMNFREQLKTNAQSLIDALHGRSTELAKIQNDANRAVIADVNQVNLLTRQIADVSSEIKLQETDHVANDLRDRRANLVKQLSEIVEVKELDSHGDYQLTTADNHLLVLNGTSQTLSTSDATTTIGNGSLSAKVAVRDQYVPTYQTALDQLAYELVQNVNSIHAGAYNLDGGTNINFFGSLASATNAASLIGLSSQVSSDARKIAASSLSTGNDNQAAIQMANLLHDPVFTGGSITDQYQNIVFSIGTDVANAVASGKEHDALAAQLENRRQSISGVSIDEETVQVMQFQRAYEASARLLRTVDEMLQVALGIGA